MMTCSRLTTTALLLLAAELVAQQSNPTDTDAFRPDKITAQAENETPTGSHVESVRFSPDGRRIVTTSAEKTARIWDAKTGMLLASPSDHRGAWQLVSFKYGESNDWSAAPPEQRRIKLITETHFTWVAYGTATKSILSAAGGTYTLNGEAYTETIEYGGEGMTEYLGKKQAFEIQVEGDRLTQSGQLSDGMKIQEVWQRLK